MNISDRGVHAIAPSSFRHFERSATQSRTRRLCEAKSAKIDLSIPLRYIRYLSDRDDDHSLGITNMIESHRFFVVKLGYK